MISFIIRWVEERMPKFTAYPVGLIGFILLAVTLFSDLFLILMNWFGWITSYMTIFFLLLTGLMIIFSGLLCLLAIRFQRKGKPLPQEKNQILNLAHPLGRSKLVLFSLTAGIGITILSATGTGLVHYTESTSFCADVCHSVMEPQSMSHRNSSHQKIRCVDCHVEAGTGPYFKAKLSGVHRLLAVISNRFDRPLPDIPRYMKPKRSSCEECHWTAKFQGDKIYNRISYASDEKNSPLYTTLMLRVGVNPSTHGIVSGVHGHMHDNTMVSFTRDKETDTIIEVQVQNKSTKESIVFRLPDYSEHKYKETETSEMTCHDCHNRVAHGLKSPEKALDNAITLGDIDRSIPFIKKNALAVLKELSVDSHHSDEEVQTKLIKIYSQNNPGVADKMYDKITHTAAVIAKIFRENVFPEMKVTWETYPSNIGHWDAPGCFRCHNEELVTKDGKTISQDCTTCHNILGEEERVPYKLKSVE